MNILKIGKESCKCIINKFIDNSISWKPVRTKYPNDLNNTWEVKVKLCLSKIGLKKNDKKWVMGYYSFVGVEAVKKIN